jgi:hypothetical protein
MHAPLRMVPLNRACMIRVPASVLCVARRVGSVSLLQHLHRIGTLLVIMERSQTLTARTVAGAAEVPMICGLGMSERTPETSEDGEPPLTVRR